MEVKFNEKFNVEIKFPTKYQKSIFEIIEQYGGNHSIYSSDGDSHLIEHTRLTYRCDLANASSIYHAINKLLTE